MITFINMDYDSSTTQWWIDYDEFVNNLEICVPF